MSTPEFVRSPDSSFAGLADYPFAPNYFDIDGLRMHYLDEGPRDAPVVLMMHGMPSWSYLYRYIIPVMVKGVSRVDDAKRVVDLGATTLSVSNHGGNNLDGTPAPIRALPAIADAVGSQIEIVLDGGVRRGSDVVKAVALGARAVMIGRAYLWGLAANGQAGVENVLDVLRGGIDSAMLGLGKANISELTRDDIVIPPDFLRALGTK